jgi:hypothetical protein
MKTKLFLFLLLTQTLASLGGNTFLETQDQSNRELPSFGICCLPRPDTEETSCASSSDCEVKQYCSAGQCRGFGDCASDFDCRNPGNMYSVMECTGPLKCNDEGNCGRECGNPCENGTGGFQCLVQPCSNAKNTCETTFVSCLNDYCRGCDPLVFDAAGNHEECTGNVVVSNICASTSDCGEGYYCSFGECREFGQCSNKVDCFNPENEYVSIHCTGGVISCESETCVIACGGSSCPDDQPPVDNCSSPCSDLKNACKEKYAFCMDDNCGGCNAIALDASGTQVCIV